LFLSVLRRLRRLRRLGMRLQEATVIVDVGLDGQIYVVVAMLAYGRWPSQLLLARGHIAFVAPGYDVSMCNPEKDINSVFSTTSCIRGLPAKILYCSLQ
jgi:predicted amino acid dehydrogenase